MASVLGLLAMSEAGKLLDARKVPLKVVKSFIGKQQIGVALDLGCGGGALGELIRENCRYLIGVDKDEERLAIAAEKAVYDELVVCDMREYPIPPEVNAVFMLEAIEHIPHEDGEKIFDAIWDKEAFITTPIKFYKEGERVPHVSVWSVEEFEAYGFTCRTFSVSLLYDAFLGGEIFAYKEAI